MLITADNLDITKIKVVIWDLDNTFWDGIITEGEIQAVHKNIDLIKALSSHGIVNSICSKNNFDECKRKLIELGVWEYFVFPSIDWTPKTNRVLQIIEHMNLRPVNSLFLDDEPANLQRVLSIDNSVMCGTAQELVDVLAEQVLKLKEDPICRRLKQYHELENKLEARTQFDSDDEFLHHAGIRIHLGRDTQSKVDRIVELINRTNQLNYTKKRIEKDEVEMLLNDPEYECAYVLCKDNYCDYGIVGFYALSKEEGRLEHYLFSCRTIGMGIEQFIYSYLGFPQLTVNGDVVTSLNKTDCPDWVTLVDNWSSLEKTKKASDKILVKGPCDVSQIIPFFSDGDLFETEFAYISQEKKGMYIEAFNHSSQILASLKLSENEKKKMAETVPFIDSKYYQTSIFEVKYDYIIFSLLSDYSLGLYRNKKDPDIVVPFGQYTRDFTKRENWNYAVSVLMQDGKTNEVLEAQYKLFQENYEPIGHVSDDQLLQNLQEIRDRIDKDTTIIFINGAEMPFKGECKQGYENREKLHIHFNAILEDFINRNSNCHIINVNDYFEDDDPYLDTINHYKKVVYYRIAQGIKAFISENGDDRDLAIRAELLNPQKKITLHRILAKIVRKMRDK